MVPLMSQSEDRFNHLHLAKDAALTRKASAA
jgi:hypothetical protein